MKWGKDLVLWVIVSVVAILRVLGVLSITCGSVIFVLMPKKENKKIKTKHKIKKKGNKVYV